MLEDLLDNSDENLSGEILCCKDRAFWNEIV
jgi:hypothetical protein